MLKKKLSSKTGRPSLVYAKKEKILAFLEQPDISYCSPSRKETAYCGKSDGVKVCHLKHYLSFTYRELDYS